MIFKVVFSGFPGKVLVYLLQESLETVGEETDRVDYFRLWSL